MKACGLVVEYNPFHNGHVLHARKSREKTGADIVVAVMSGPFLQRGEPALVSKWTRAAMALQGGIDLVIELPYAFATQKAEIFAKGSISLLEYLGCDSFCFGSEDGRIEPFITANNVISDQSAAFDAAVKSAMDAGNSYPASAAQAYQAIIKNEGALDLTKPNNILGKEYVSAALTNGFSIRPYTIKRVAAGYHDTDLSNDSIASATGIRKAIHEEQGKSLDSVSSYIPKPTRIGLEQYLSSYRSLHDWEMYWPLLKYRILSSSLSELAAVYEIEEGIEHRIQQMAKTAATFSQFMTALKTKRYTWTRLQRMCVHILTHTSKEQMANTHLPAYIRLLGMNNKGREYLHTVKKDLPLPLISKLSAFQKQDIEMDIRAAQVYALGLSESDQASLMKREYAAPIITK
ncbi:nucleotidyltransferase [Peribacillus muralis]|uniref:nucleotidyltransferase n=1 Tax=Peribacillus muralis TaxID=264697 RepID=UPI00070AF317|nr:nucleotidyltransferase [Peribacillus muralis]